MRKYPDRIQALVIGASLVFGCITVNAGIPDVRPAEGVRSSFVAEDILPCESFFDATTFPMGDGIVNELKLIGRYHGQYYRNGADQDYETRRLRVGVEAMLFNDKLFFRNNWNIGGLNDSDEELGFDTIYELLVAFNVGEKFHITLGKQKPIITSEYRESSKEIITFERSALVNELVPDAAWGGRVDTSVDKTSFSLGLFASSFSGDGRGWFDTNGGAFFVANVGYDLTGICPIGADSAIIRLDYAYTKKAREAAPEAENVVSLNYDGTNGNFHLNWDLLGGFDDATNVFGAIILPSYHVTGNLEVVGRYQFADGDVLLQNRYEGLAVDSLEASNYHAFYVGANYYICENNLKLMAGLEYATASGRDGTNGYDGFTLLTGVRLYF